MRRTVGYTSVAGRAVYFTTEEAFEKFNAAYENKYTLIPSNPLLLDPEPGDLRWGVTSHYPPPRPGASPPRGPHFESEGEAFAWAIKNIPHTVAEELEAIKLHREGVYYLKKFSIYMLRKEEANGTQDKES